MSTPSTNPAPGAYPNVKFEDYTQWQAISWHRLDPFRVSSLNGYHQMRLERDATSSMVFGGAFHTAILEPHRFDPLYSVMPQFEGHPNSNAYKSQKAAWLEHHTESVTLTSDEMSLLRGMQRSVAAHPTASAILKCPGRNELSLLWNDKETGATCKGRVDRLCRVPAEALDANATGEVICAVDFKTTARLQSFDNEVAKYGYAGQLAFYESGLQTIEPTEILSLIVAIESVPPFDVVVYTCADAVDNGRKLYRRLLRQYLECKATNRWPGICPVGTIPVVLPVWARERE